METESTRVAARDWGKESRGSEGLMGTGFQFCKMKMNFVGRRW